MTALETAIILISFITVATVFSYAVISAGLFSADSGKETHFAALREVSSNMEISGSVIALTSDNSTINRLIVSLKNTAAGNPVEMTPCDGTASAQNKCSISLITARSYISNIKWSAQAMGNNDGDNLLEEGEHLQITINLNDLGDGKAMADNLTANRQFTILIKPAIGSAITIQRTIPPNITPAIDIY